MLLLENYEGKNNMILLLYLQLWTDEPSSLHSEVFGQLTFSPDSKWRHYMQCVDGQFIATSSLHFGADVVTRPTYCQNVRGTAITLLTYEEAINLGGGLALCKPLTQTPCVCIIVLER